MDKQLLISKAAIFPQVFKILPIIEGKPEERGTWAAYPNDNSTIIWVNTSHVEAQRFYQEQIKQEEVYQMSKELSVAEDRTIKTMIAGNMKAIKSILPKHITPERFARIAYTSIVSNPTLARCSQLSLINTIIEASTLGLEIGGAMREASLIPFKNGKTNTYEATLVVEYPGLIKLAKNTGDIKNITAHPVFSKDEFRYNYGLNPDLIHVPSNESDKGSLAYAYCIIWYTNGGVDFEVVGFKEAEAAKEKSAAKYKKDSPWNQEENVPAMWVKTAIRRIMKRVPKAAEKRFLDVDEMSGSEMTHVNSEDGIINLSPDDFHSFSMKKGDNKPKQEQKTDNKKESAKKQEAEKQPEPETKELSKAVKHAVYLKEHFPEFKQACEELGYTFSSPVEQWDEKSAVEVCKKVDELVDAQN